MTARKFTKSERAKHINTVCRIFAAHGVALEPRPCTVWENEHACERFYLAGGSAYARAYCSDHLLSVYMGWNTGFRGPVNNFTYRFGVYNRATDPRKWNIHISPDQDLLLPDIAGLADFLAANNAGPQLPKHDAVIDAELERFGAAIEAWMARSKEPERLAA